MIACDGCDVWQHVYCMQVDPGKADAEYKCERCEPRSVDIPRAKAHQEQVARKQAESESESDRDEDNTAFLTRYGHAFLDCLNF